MFFSIYFQEWGLIYSPFPYPDTQGKVAAGSGHAKRLIYRQDSPFHRFSFPGMDKEGYF
jgi:hypothetical protein